MEGALTRMAHEALSFSMELPELQQGVRRPSPALLPSISPWSVSAGACQERLPSLTSSISIFSMSLVPLQLHAVIAELPPLRGHSLTSFESRAAAAATARRLNAALEKLDAVRSAAGRGGGGGPRTMELG